MILMAKRYSRYQKAIVLAPSRRRCLSRRTQEALTWYLTATAAVAIEVCLSIQRCSSPACVRQVDKTPDESAAFGHSARRVWFGWGIGGRIES